MKKFSLIMALILTCTVLFASCSVNKPGKEETSTTETSTEKTAQSTTEVTKPLTPEEEKEYDAVKKVAYNLAMAETREDIKACVIQYTDDYADYVLGGLPEKDYTVEVKKLAEYKDVLIYEIITTRESDPDYIYSGIQLFSYTEDGELLINLDTDLEDEVCEKFVCEACDGQGCTLQKAQTSGGYDEYIPCEVCDEVGFVFDKVTE